MHETAGKTRMTFFNGPLQMDVPVLANQQELIYVCFVRTQDVVIGPDRERERERERESVKSVLS